MSQITNVREVDDHKEYLVLTEAGEEIGWIHEEVAKTDHKKAVKVSCKHLHRRDLTSFTPITSTNPPAPHSNGPTGLQS
jgi:hypothetical protein